MYLFLVLMQIHILFRKLFNWDPFIISFLRLWKHVLYSFLLASLFFLFNGFSFKNLIALSFIDRLKDSPSKRKCSLYKQAFFALTFLERSLKHWINQRIVISNKRSHRRCSRKNVFLRFRKIHRKTPVPE